MSKKYIFVRTKGKKVKLHPTKKFIRERVKEPSTCKEDSFVTKDAGEHKIVLCKPKGKNKLEVQAILHTETLPEVKKEVKKRYSRQLETKDGKLYAGGKPVIKGWESDTGWYWFATERDGNNWYGYVQGFENEWGSFSEEELKPLIKQNRVWAIKPQDLPYAGKRYNTQLTAKEKQKELELLKTLKPEEVQFLLEYKRQEELHPQYGRQLNRYKRNIRGVKQDKQYLEDEAAKLSKEELVAILDNKKLVPLELSVYTKELEKRNR